jgi:hypothetical protein
MWSIIRSLGLSVPLLMGAGSAWAEMGRILSFDGDVRVNGEQITSDTVIKKNDVIVTGPDATVQVILADNSVLDLDSNSEIDIDEYVFNPSEPEENTSQISVLAGTLRYVSGKIAKDDPTDVSFAAGQSTIGVRGTYISISVCPDEGCD